MIPRIELPEIDAENALLTLLANMSIDEKAVRGPVEINNSHNVNEIVILNSHIQKLVISSDKIMRIHISNSEVTKFIVKNDSKIEEISIRRESVIHKFKIEPGVTCLAFELKEQSSVSYSDFSSIPKSVVVEGKSFLTDAHFTNSGKFDSELSFKDCPSGRLLFTLAKVSDINLSLSRFEFFAIQESDIINLRIEKNTFFKELIIDDASLSNLDFKDPLKFEESDITINNCIIEKLRITNYFNEGFFKLTNSEITKELLIKNSELSNGLFNGVDWPDAAISFDRSHVSRCNFFNIKWNETYSIREPKMLMDSSENKHWECMDSYRQLKSADQNQDNYIEASKFKHHELRMYYELMHYYTWNNFRIRKFGTWLRSNRIEWWKNLGEYLILWTSKKGSNFGESVGLPLRNLLKFHLVFFILLLILVEGLPVGFTTFSNHSWDAFREGSRLFVYTLNPAHSYEIDGVPIYGIVDTLMRISSGYFIFYFLKAARKFHIT